MTFDEFLETILTDRDDDAEFFNPIYMEKLAEKRKEYDKKFGEGAIDDAIYMDPLNFDGSKETLQDIIDGIDEQIRKGKEFPRYSDLRKQYEETGDYVIF